MPAACLGWSGQRPGGPARHRRLRSAALPPRCGSPRAPGLRGPRHFANCEPAASRPCGPQLFQAVLKPAGLRWCPLGAPGRLPEESARTAPRPIQVLSGRPRSFELKDPEAHRSIRRRTKQMFEERRPKARRGGASSGHHLATT